MKQNIESYVKYRYNNISILNRITDNNLRRRIITIILSILPNISLVIIIIDLEQLFITIERKSTRNNINIIYRKMLYFTFTLLSINISSNKFSIVYSDFDVHSEHHTLIIM